MREQETVYWVEVIDRSTEELIAEYYCGADEEFAMSEKDKIDLIWDDGSTYTKIVTDFLEIKE